MISRYTVSMEYGHNLINSTTNTSLTFYGTINKPFMYFEKSEESDNLWRGFPCFMQTTLVITTHFIVIKSTTVVIGLGGWDKYVEQQSRNSSLESVISLQNTVISTYLYKWLHSKIIIFLTSDDVIIYCYNYWHFDYLFWRLFFLKPIF